MNRDHEELIGNSSTFATALERVSNLASINRPALIIGERGTGKELAAERLHFLSARWDRQFVKVNCAAISEELLDSELFGHEPGAFTGATRIHYGRFERADKGTLFLDELATMSTRLQEKLLRLIEYGEFERVGGSETLKVDVRIVAATNADLRQYADSGKFREDLLDRLSFDVVHLPPLRFRSEDIEVLAQHFAVQMCREMHWEYFLGFTDSALDELNQYHWPGNVRELKNVVERSIYRWADPDQAVDKIILDPFDSPYTDIEKPSPATSDGNQPDSNQSEQTSLMPEQRNHSSEQPITTDFNSQVQTFEKKILLAALEQHHSHQGRTAKALDLSYHQFRGLLRKYKIGGRQKN